MTPNDHMLDLIEKELDAYRQSGRVIHLAHAARALEDIRTVLAKARSSGTRSSGGGADVGFAK